MSARISLAAVGAAQGLAVWLLVDSWPEAHGARALCVGLLTFLVTSAAVFHFAWTSEQVTRLVLLALATGLTYGLVATWVGWGLAAENAVSDGSGERVTTWIFASVVTLYVLGPFLQIYQRTGRWAFAYEDLFLHSWNNFFVALIGALFAGSLWIVLLLWASLFDVIGIEVFGDLFSEPLFVYVATGAAAGFGIALGRESERIVATLRTITLQVFTGLLPLVCFVALLFLAALPLTGLAPLWKTDRASSLLIAWVVVSVLFFNAVYQEGEREQPLPRLLRRLVEAGLIATSGFLAISAWGLWLRIDQYGLTPARMWAVLLWVVLAAYALGYTGAVLLRGSPWLPAVRPVNRTVAWLVIALGLLAHTPVLDPLGWSARSQYRRIAEGRVPAAGFDYGYLRFQLGREGTDRFEQLASLDAHPELEQVRAGVTRAREVENYRQWQGEPWEDLRVIEALAQETAAPPALVEAIRRTADVQAERCTADSCVLVSVDLSNGASDEWVIASSVGDWTRLHAFGEEEPGRFVYLGTLLPTPAPSIASALREGRFESVPSEHRDLSIDGRRFRLVPP